MPTVVDVLAEAVEKEPSGAGLADIRAILESHAETAAVAAGWSADEPLRLAKASTGWLLRCTKRATAPRREATGHALAVGAVVDAVAKIASLRPLDPGQAVDAGIDWLRADAGAAAVIAWIDELDDEAREAFAVDTGERTARLLESWPAPAPWVRVDEWARVSLCDGAISVAGRLDIVFGGPPTSSPSVVVEVKSGGWRDEHRTDAQLYALLVALRDGRLPHAVVTVCAGDGKTNVEPVRPGGLEAAAERLGAALERAADLAAGEVPHATPGSWCGACWLQPSCPEGRALIGASAAP